MWLLQIRSNRHAEVYNVFEIRYQQTALSPDAQDAPIRYHSISLRDAIQCNRSAWRPASDHGDVTDCWGIFISLDSVFIVSILLRPFAVVQGEQGQSEDSKLTVKEQFFNEDELYSQLGLQNVKEERREEEHQSNETNKTRQGLH